MKMQAATKRLGEIVTFYSYKGGTGRSMSLVNLACLLAAKLEPGNNILLLDWDLEAPGLHRYFHGRMRVLPTQSGDVKKVEPAEAWPGLMDLFVTLQAAANETMVRRKRKPEARAKAAWDGIKLDDYIVGTHIPNLHLMKAGRFDDDYNEQINAFDWEALYYDSPSTFREFAQRLKEKYRYIFIDSRTGLTDTSGICTALMPEKLVVVFTPNRQNLLGVDKIVRQAVDYRKVAADPRPLAVYPLVSRVEVTLDDLRAKWRFGDASRQIEGYEPFFGKLLKEVYGLEHYHLKKYFDEVQIKQSPIYAYGEEIAVLNEKAERIEDSYSLTQAYQKFLDWLEPGYLPWTSPDAIRLLAILENRIRLGAEEKHAIAEGVAEATRLANALRIEGDLGNARMLAAKVHQVAREHLGPENPRMLDVMNTLASILYAQGKLAGARELQVSALSICRSLLDEQHPETLLAMNNLAGILQAQGDLPGARELQVSVLEARRSLLGGEHPDTLTSMNNLASTLQAQGDLAGARKLEVSVLEARRRMLGEAHPDTLTSMSNLATTLQAQGDLAGARKLEESALTGRRHLLGEAHLDTLSSMNNLATTLQAQGHWAGARELQESVLAKRSSLLGEAHPDTLTAMSNLAATLQAQGDLAGARKLEVSVLEARRRVLGEEHPDTLSSMVNLASTLFAQGDLAGARKLEESALAAGRRQLGEEHPGTLTFMNNLAYTLRAQGDLSRARKLLESALAGRRNALGEMHPDTLDSMDSLADLAFALGDLEESQALKDEICTVRQRRARQDQALSADASTKIMGIGGAGVNAIEAVARTELPGVEFIAVNTDEQSLKRSSAKNQIRLGTGLGAGGNPDIGRDAAAGQKAELRTALERTRILFIVAGFGGGTGTGAAPVVAEIARELGILTIAIVSTPFAFEGKRVSLAEKGLAELAQHVDSLIVIPADRLFELLGDEATMDQLFNASDEMTGNVLRGIAEITNLPGLVNIDFEDLRTVLGGMGFATIGFGTAAGADRASIAADSAVNGLLMGGKAGLFEARGVLVSITAPKTLKMKEINSVMNRIRQLASHDAHIIFGAVFDETIQDQIRVTVVATGLKTITPSQISVANPGRLATG